MSPAMRSDIDRDTAAPAIPPDVLRRRLVRQVREHEKKQREASLTRAREAINNAAMLTNMDPAELAVGASLMQTAVEECRSVILSLGLDPVLDVTPTNQWSTAHTDFRTLSVRVNIGSYDETNPHEIARLVALTRGLVYHEAGHLLFSLPWDQINEAARHTRTFSDRGFEIVLGSENPRDREIDDWRREAANLLEDQRMELALIRTSPVLAHYLRVAVGEMIIRPSIKVHREHEVWPFICGRRYLDPIVRRRFQLCAWDFARDHGMVDELTAIEASVTEYAKASTIGELWDAANLCAAPLEAWIGFSWIGNPNSRAGQLSLDTHIDGSYRNERVDLSESRTILKAERTPRPLPMWVDIDRPPRNQIFLDGRPRATSTGLPGTPQNTTSSTSGESTSTETAGAPSTAEGESKLPVVAIAPARTSPVPSYTAVHSILDESIRTAVSARIVNEVVGAMNAARRRGMATVPTLRPLTEAEIDQANAVANAMLAVLETVVDPVDRAWVSRASDGVLDPVQYRLRSTGEDDFWGAMVDSTNETQDVALSLLLDFSGSMTSEMQNVSVGAMGIRSACDQLGIPCTITAFNTNAYLVLDHDEPTRMVGIKAEGGTDPGPALLDLPNQRAGRARHFVVVFTDGCWSEGTSVNSYRAHEMHCVGLGYGEGVAESLKNKGFDAIARLSSPRAIPDAVSHILRGLLA